MVEKGIQAKIELPYNQSQSWQAEVAQVYYMLDEKTRTAQARIELPNDANRTLRPGMYATVLLQGRPADPMPVVSNQAVLRSGEQNMVVIALGEGKFRPVEVKIGMESSEKIQIIEGLAGGEEIVTSAQFLIDSEARLKSAVSAMIEVQDNVEENSLPIADDRPEIDVRSVDKNQDDIVFLCLDKMPALADNKSELTDCPVPIEETSIGLAHAFLKDTGYQNAPLNVEAFDHNHDGTVYQCPMDWSIITDQKGQCELCNMNLEPFSIDETKQNLIREGFGIVE